MTPILDPFTGVGQPATWGDLHRLAEVDPRLHAMLRLYDSTDLSMEQFLLSGLCYYSQAHIKLESILTKVLELQSLPPITLNVTQEKADEIKRQTG